MKGSNVFPSKYIKAADLEDKPHTMVMSRVELEDIGDAERKPVLYFTKAKKGLVLNRTNWRTIAAAYGDESDNWEGKSLVLFPAMVDFRGDTVEAIRVRIPKPAAAPKANPAAPGGDNDPPWDDHADNIADTF